MCQIYDVNMIICKKRYLTNGRELLFSVLSNIYYNCFVVCSLIEILKETKMMLINQNYFGYVTYLEHIHHLVSNHWILFFGYKIHVDHINIWPNKMHKLKMHDVLWILYPNHEWSLFFVMRAIPLYGCVWISSLLSSILTLPLPSIFYTLYL